MEEVTNKNPRKLKILEYDPALASFEGELRERMKRYRRRKRQLLADGQSLSDFASGHLYYGFHKTKTGWVYREWAPGAKEMHLIGDFNGWDRTSHPMKPLGNGNWEIEIPGKRTLRHLSNFKVCVTS